MTTPRGVRSWRWRQAARRSPRAVPRGRNSRARRGRWSGSTWTSRRSTTPTTRWSMRPIASRSPNAGSPTATRRARSSARPSARAYGPSEIEKLDIYRTKQANAPVNIFIHGGAWRANRAADYACLAEPFVKAGGALRHPRLHQCRRRRRQPVPDDRAGAARGRLGLQECQELRRRSEPALSDARIPPAPTSAAAW